MVPTIVSAHTHLTASNPAEGQVVVDEIKEIRLTFDGNIEKLSSMKIFKDSTELSGITIQVDATNMTGTLQEPLGNGAYFIEWNIAGEDGHPISGKINFTVQTGEKSNEPATPPATGEVPDTPVSNQGSNTEGQQTAGGNDTSDEVMEVAMDTTNENSQSNTTTIITIFGFVFILGIGLLLIRKKN